MTNMLCCDRCVVMTGVLCYDRCIVLWQVCCVMTGVLCYDRGIVRWQVCCYDRCAVLWQMHCAKQVYCYDRCAVLWQMHCADRCTVLWQRHCAMTGVLCYDRCIHSLEPKRRQQQWWTRVCTSASTDGGQYSHCFVIVHGLPSSFWQWLVISVIPVAMKWPSMVFVLTKKNIFMKLIGNVCVGWRDGGGGYFWRIFYRHTGSISVTEQSK